MLHLAKKKEVASWAKALSHETAWSAWGNVGHSSMLPPPISAVPGSPKICPPLPRGLHLVQVELTLSVMWCVSEISSPSAGEATCGQGPEPQGGWLNSRAAPCDTFTDKSTRWTFSLLSYSMSNHKYLLSQCYGPDHVLGPEHIRFLLSWRLISSWTGADKHINKSMRGVISESAKCYKIKQLCNGIQTGEGAIKWRKGLLLLVWSEKGWGSNFWNDT